MKIVNSLDSEQIKKLNELYQNEWWCKGRSIEDTEKVVFRSSIVFGAIDGEILIGFARILTDYVFKAIIFDVIVDPNYRKNGVGSMIMGAIKQHDDLKAVKHFELYCRSDMVPYYQEHGFTDNLGDMQIMRFVPK